MSPVVLRARCRRCVQLVSIGSIDVFTRASMVNRSGNGCTSSNSAIRGKCRRLTGSASPMTKGCSKAIPSSGVIGSESKLHADPPKASNRRSSSLSPPRNRGFESELICLGMQKVSKTKRNCTLDSHFSPRPTKTSATKTHCQPLDALDSGRLNRRHPLDDASKSQKNEGQN